MLLLPPPPPPPLLVLLLPPPPAGVQQRLLYVVCMHALPSGCCCFICGFHTQITGTAHTYRTNRLAHAVALTAFKPHT